MKNSKLFIFTLFLILSSTANAKPPISEYTNIPKGLLLEHEITNPNQYGENINSLSNSDEKFISSSISMNEVLEKFKQGKYVEIKDEVKAKAEENTIVAARLLGMMYKYGYGMDINHNEALKWLSKAAESMDAEAQQHLALMYFKGEVVNKNIAEALKWLKISSLLVTDEDLKEAILKDYKTVLISANRRQKLTAANKVKSWLAANNKSKLLEKKD